MAPLAPRRIAVASTVLASLVLVAAPAAVAAEQPAAAGVDAPSTPSKVLIELHHANQKEIQMGQQAKEKGESAEVRNYGETLIRDHRDADQKVEKLAEKMNVELTPPQKEVHQVPAGAGFDEHFAKMMVEDHKKDIQKMREARDNLSDPQVKELIGDVLPTLEKHLDEAQDIANKT